MRYNARLTRLELDLGIKSRLVACERCGQTPAERVPIPFEPLELCPLCCGLVISEDFVRKLAAGI